MFELSQTVEDSSSQSLSLNIKLCACLLSLSLSLSRVVAELKTHHVTLLAPTSGHKLSLARRSQHHQPPPQIFIFKYLNPIFTIKLSGMFLLLGELFLSCCRDCCFRLCLCQINLYLSMFKCCCRDCCFRLCLIMSLLSGHKLSLERQSRHPQPPQIFLKKADFLFLDFFSQKLQFIDFKRCFYCLNKVKTAADLCSIS